jgi:hypothetical protein
MHEKRNAAAGDCGARNDRLASLIEFVSTEDEAAWQRWLCRGPAVGAAASEADCAGLALTRMALRLDAVRLEITEPVADLLADVFGLARGLAALADQIGHAEVERRVAL